MLKYWKIVLPLLVGAVFLLLPPPAGLTQNAWIYFAIFMAVVVGLVLEPIPGALIGLIGIGVLVWLRLGAAGSGEIGASIKPSEAIKWGLSGFSNSTVWLIFAAFMLGLGYAKSGLGRRIALFLVKTLGKTTLGLGYAIALADGVLAPFIPSNSARSGGIIYPIVSSIPPMLDSYPDRGARKIGSYLVWVSLAATCVTSSMFFTALAPNLLAMETAVKGGFSGISWLGWFIAFAPCGILLFILTPLLTYYIYPPEIKGSKEASKWAEEELKKMDKMSRKEYLMLALAFFALIFWIGGSSFGVDSTTVALSVMMGMVIFGVISWEDVLGNRTAWNVLAWFGSLVTLAGGLKNVGFLDWVALEAEVYLQGLSPMTATLGLVVCFYLLHYFFASTTAHVTALLSLFIAVGAKIAGLNVQQVTLLMILSLGIMGIITPYGTGPSPVWYGSGYIKSADFWRLGFIFGLIYLVVFLLVCVPWVKNYAFKFIGA